VKGGKPEGYLKILAYEHQFFDENLRESVVMHLKSFSNIPKKH